MHAWGVVITIPLLSDFLRVVHRPSEYCGKASFNDDTDKPGFLFTHNFSQTVLHTQDLIDDEASHSLKPPSSSNEGSHFFGTGNFFHELIRFVSVRAHLTTREITEKTFQKAP
jgi:hypothetical protein